MSTQRNDRVDETLRIWVASTNASTERRDSESGGTITVTSNGAVISGRMIPGWQWFADHGSEDTGPSDDDRRVADLFEKEESDLSEEEVAFLESHQPNYLHLGWSHIFVGGLGGVLPSTVELDEPMTMRIRLSSIDGWSLSMFSPKPREDAEATEQVG